MIIDTTINLGTIVTAILAVIGFSVAFTKIGGRIDLLAQRVGAVEEALKAHSDVHVRVGDLATRVAIIETRQATHGQLIATTQKELSDLRRGRGFVQDRSSGGVDGEYP